MIDRSKERVFPVRDIPERIGSGRNGKKRHRSIGYRWHRPGLRNIPLETFWEGGTLMTSEEALQRFFERVTAARENERTPTKAEPAFSTREAERASRELDKLGF
jgi:hypothetical protein